MKNNKQGSVELFAGLFVLLVLGTLLIFVGVCFGFPRGLDHGIMITQQEAIKKGYGRYVIVGPNQTKFEWLPANEEKTLEESKK